MLERTSRHPVKAHSWDLQTEEWYVEETWCSARLFDAYDWNGGVWDPSCGRGNILEAAASEKVYAVGTDLVSRGSTGFGSCGGVDFLATTEMPALTRHIASNPPFKLADKFVLHALELIDTGARAAFIYPTRRLNAAHKWMRPLPLKDVLFLTPRPSMPPGDVYEELLSSGQPPSGGKQDFCWLIFQRGYDGPRSYDWLIRRPR